MYVVIVKPPDDHPGAVRVVGPFRRWDNAQAYADKITSAVEKAEDGDVDRIRGWAYVKQVRRPLVKDAKLWALEGREVPNQEREPQ